MQLKSERTPAVNAGQVQPSIVNLVKSVGYPFALIVNLILTDTLITYLEISLIISVKSNRNFTRKS